MNRCPRCWDPLERASDLCPRCTTQERRRAGVAKRPRGPGSGFAAALRVVEVAVGSSAFVGVAYLLATTAGLIAPLDLARLLGTPAIAATEFRVDPMAAAPPPPYELALADAEVIHLPSGDHYNASFVVRDPRPCMLTGHVMGLSGGSRDVEVYVLDDEGYSDWQKGVRPRTLFQSGRSTATSLAVPLPRRGRYHLLLSNRYSFLTAKRVRIDDARLRCA